MTLKVDSDIQRVKINSEASEREKLSKSVKKELKLINIQFKKIEKIAKNIRQQRKFIKLLEKNEG